MVHVVINLSGGPRIVGVFAREEDARRIVGPFSAYWKIYPCELDRIDPGCVGSATSAAKEQHLRVVVEEAKVRRRAPARKRKAP